MPYIGKQYTADRMIFIAGMPVDVQISVLEQQVKRLLSPHCTVELVSLRTKGHNTYGFITIGQNDDVDSVINICKGSIIAGKRVAMQRKGINKEKVYKKCQFCGRLGHLVNQCRDYAKKQVKQPEITKKQNVKEEKKMDRNDRRRHCSGSEDEQERKRKDKNRDRKERQHSRSRDRSNKGKKKKRVYQSQSQDSSQEEDEYVKKLKKMIKYSLGISYKNPSSRSKSKSKKNHRHHHNSSDSD